MHLLRELSRALCWKPRGILAAPNADLSHNHKVWVVGVKRFANDLIGDVRAIKIAGVDMVDARFHRTTPDRHRFGAFEGRAEPARSGQLHRAIAHPVYDQHAQWEGLGRDT